MATVSKQLTKSEFAARTVRFIGQGKLDSYLETIVNAANDRRRVIRDIQVSENMITLNKPGTRVRIAGRLRPKYLLGYTGTVMDRVPEGFRKAAGVIYVDLGRRVRSCGPVVGIPANCLEAIDD